MLNLPANFERDIQGRDTALVPVVVLSNDRPNTTYPDYRGADGNPDFLAISTNQMQLSFAKNWTDWYNYEMAGEGNEQDWEPWQNFTTKPLLLNVPSLKESIDTEKRNYKISSVNIDISNFPSYDGKRFSDLILDSHHVEDSLINVECRIFWVSPSTNNIEFYDFANVAHEESYGDFDAFQIYYGTIRRYTHDDEKVRLVVEDRSQATLHKDLPIAEVGLGDDVPSKYKGVKIPMVYGHVEKSPCVISRSAPLGDEAIIYEDVVIEADSSDGIALNAEYDEAGNQITSPLFISTGSSYAKVPHTHNDIYFPDTDRDFYSSTQYIIDSQNKNILLTSSYQGTSDSSTIGGNSISNNQLLVYETITPTTFLPLQVESSQEIGVSNYWYTTLLDPTWSDAKRIHGTLFFEHGVTDGWNGESLLDGTDIPEDFIPFPEAYQGSLVGCQIKVPITTPSNLKASLGYVRVHIKAGFYNKYNFFNGSTTEPVDIRVRFGGNKHGDNSFYKLYKDEELEGTGNTWTEEDNQLNPLSDDDGYGDFDTHNSFSGSDLPRIVENVETLLCYMKIESGSNIMIGVIDFVDIEVDHWMQISDMLNQDFYADVKGRGYTEGYSLTAPAIISHLAINELGTSQPSWDTGQYIGWDYAFTVDKKINSKKLIEGIASASPYIPRFDNMGNFKLNVIPEAGGTADHTIKEADCIDFSFSKTKIEDVKSRIIFKYNWDYARGEFNDSVETDTNTLTGYNLGYYGLPDDHSESTLIIDDHRGKYIRKSNDHSTAQEFAKWYLYWHCNQHLKIRVRLGLKYMNLEIGDFVDFDAILGGVKPYGIDYTIDQSQLNGQIIYSNFLITSTNKTLEWVEIEAIMMHNLLGEILDDDDIIPPTTFEAGTYYYVISSPELDGALVANIHTEFPELSSLSFVNDYEGLGGATFFSNGIWIGGLMELEGNHAYSIKFDQETTTSLFELDD